MKKLLRLLTIITATCGLLHAAQKKPLKVFVLVGQSNMEGHASATTLENLTLQPPAPELAGAMQKNGEPVTSDDVYISYLTGVKENVVKEGKLTVGFGSQGKDPKFGPEYSFGIFMEKALNEPILIIKTAWGGKSLFNDFRPPSAGSSPVGDKDTTGHYYRLMTEHVKKILSDPGKVHPAYDEDAGYEMAGFVWFQGWNDMVAQEAYPNRTQPGGYDAYSEVLADFIRDVRMDFVAPKMPFVIGVMGIEGIVTPETEAARPPRYRGITPNFRAAMAKPASMPEFNGNVIAVHTELCWDTKIDEIIEEQKKVKDLVDQMSVEKKIDDKEKARLLKEATLKLIPKEDLHYLATGKSNQGYHYNGSPRTIGCIGKSFADALIKWHAAN